MAAHERGTVTAEDRAFFKIQMTNLTGNPQATLADVLEVLEKTLRQSTQFNPDAIVGEHRDDFADDLREYVEEFDDRALDFGELCSVIGEDVDRCRDLIGRTGGDTRLSELEGTPVVKDGILHPADEPAALPDAPFPNTPR